VTIEHQHSNNNNESIVNEDNDSKREEDCMAAEISKRRVVVGETISSPISSTPRSSHGAPATASPPALFSLAEGSSRTVLSPGVLAGLTLASNVSVAIRTAMAFDDPQTHRWFLAAPIYVFAGLWIDTTTCVSSPWNGGDHHHHHHYPGITEYVAAGGFVLLTVLFVVPSFFNMAFGIYSIMLSAPVLSDHTMPYPARVNFMASGLLANTVCVALLLWLRGTLEARFYWIVQAILVLLSGILLVQAQAMISNQPFSLYLLIPRPFEHQTLHSDSDSWFLVDYLPRWHQTLSTVFRSKNFFVWLVVELILEAIKVLWSGFAERELMLLHKMVAALILCLPMYVFGYRLVYQRLFTGMAVVCWLYELRGDVISPKWIVAAILCGFQWAGYQLVVADLVSEYEHFQQGQTQIPSYGATILGTVAALRPFVNTVRDFVSSKHLMEVTVLLSCIQCLVWYQYDFPASRRHSDHPDSHTV
jgi:hypothetical protein